MSSTSKYNYQNDKSNNPKYGQIRFSRRVFNQTKNKVPIYKKIRNADKNKSSITLLLHETELHKLQKKATEDFATATDDIDSKEKKMKESEKLKEEFKAKQIPQPKLKKENSINESDEIKELTKKRAIELQEERFQGARIANQIILASKCHAIRDAQLREKIHIKQQINDENKRLDEMMEKARIVALEKEVEEYNEKKTRRLENIEIIKRQIEEHEKLKIAEKKYTYKELNLLNQTDIDLHMQNKEKSREKKLKAQNLMENLNKCKEELEDCKQKQLQDDKAMEERIKIFVQQRKERDRQLKYESKEKKEARERIISFIAKAQETAKKHREELENIRILKVQEEVEREYRAKEKAAAMKKINELKNLKEERSKQIEHIRQQTAVEMSRNDEILKCIAEKNREDAQKEESKIKERQEALINHRQSIIKQINDKERKKIEMRKTAADEGVALKLQFDEVDNMEKTVVRRKIEKMKEQKIPEPYISEVEHRLAKLKYYDK